MQTVHSYFVLLAYFSFEDGKTYGLSHIDFDIEGYAVADPASIALNSQALALLQQTKPEVKIWYTLPVLPTGLTADGLNAWWSLRSRRA